MQFRHWLRRGHLVLSAVPLLLLACEGGTLERARAAQYPPDFHYITKGEIRTKMGELAMEVVRLDALLSQDGGPRPEDREQVLTILRDMRTLAGRLKKAGATSSHPRIADGAPRLVAVIDRAIMQVQIQEPPTYYEAGRVVGSCGYCHEPRVGPVTRSAVANPSP